MNMMHALLAQTLIPNDVIPGGWHWMGLSLRELLILLGAVSIVTLIVVIWAACFRKKPRHRSRAHHYSPAQERAELETDSEADSAEGDGGRRYRRKRRRRREHRPRNPTLAETGGLPPVRADRPADPLP
jgi:FtsZ-interacting cell division protein ZipA